MSKVLFIGKDFLDYQDKITESLSRDLNFKVITYSIRPETVIFRLSRKLFSSNARRLLQKHHEKILQSIKHMEFEYVFFTQIHHLPLQLFLNYKKRFHSSKFLLYYWDSLNKHDYSEYIEYFTTVFTFDSADATKYPKLNYLPLFYTKEYGLIRYQKVIHVKYDLLFVGSITNIDRFYQLKLFIEWAKTNNLRFYYHAFISPLEFSKLIFKGIVLFNLKFTYLKPQKVQNLFMLSKVVLDLPNNIQTGLTLRTIEAVGAGKKLITMNENISKERFYDKNKIFIAKNNFPQKDFFTDFENQDYKDNEYYSLENWLRTIFCVEKHRQELLM